MGTVARADVFKEQANFRTVHVFVLNHAGELLLQQLSGTRERNPLRWGSSVAGYLHAGETYEQAAARRLREELGLATRLLSIGVTPMRDDGVTKFVGVFVTIAESAHVQELDHIATIEFRPQADVEHDVRTQAASYTESFRHVWEFWLGQGRPGSPT